MIDRLLARYGYVKRESRGWDVQGTDMKDTSAEGRANRWIAYYNEQGGIRDMILHLRRSYFEKVGTLKPGDTDALAALGMADRICREVDSQIKEIIDAGKIEVANKEHADKIAALSPAKRRRL